MHYSPFVPSQITSSFEYSYTKSRSKRKRKARRRREVNRQPEPPGITIHQEALIKEVTERIVDDVFDTREKQHHMLLRQAQERERIEKEKQELEAERQKLAQEKQLLAMQNAALHNDASKQLEENRKLQQQLKKLQQEAEKDKRSLRGKLKQFLQSATSGDSEKSPKNKPTNFGQSTRVLDLD